MTVEQRIQIIVAIIGALGVIVAAIITSSLLRSKTVEIRIIDAETRQEIPGRVFIDASADGVVTNPGQPAVLVVRRGDRSIRAESRGYESATIPAKKIASPRTIELTPVAAGRLIPLTMAGWSTWANGKGAITISPGAAGNEAVINTNGRLEDAAGFNHNGLNILAGKTLVLQFANTAESDFNQERMVKVERNDGNVLEPANSFLLEKEYLPKADTPPDGGIEFQIPASFSGRLNFVFYQADIRNLKITAYYK